MLSPYLLAKQKYESLRTSVFTCNPDLSLDFFEKTNQLGQSASGMQFASGKKNDIDVFVKFFSTPCNTHKVILPSGKIRKREQIQFDTNAIEIGITRLMSNLLSREIPFTQNLTFVYGSNYCDNAFGVEISKCTLDPIATNSSTLVPTDISYPQSNFLANYHIGLLDDRVNYMVVEKCAGDLQTLFNSDAELFHNGRLTEYEFNETWNSIMMQILLTTIILHDIINPFYHNDLGCRNVLYSINKFKNTYFVYQLSGVTYKIKNVGIIPKIWDFSYMHIPEELKSKIVGTPEFDYFREHNEYRSDRDDEFMPCVIQLCRSFIEMENASYVQETEFMRNIKTVSEYDHDMFADFILLFDKYSDSEDDELLEPIFVYE